MTRVTQRSAGTGATGRPLGGARAGARSGALESWDAVYAQTCLHRQGAGTACSLLKFDGPHPTQTPFWLKFSGATSRAH